jgi:nucleoid-associated protein YgaU
LETNRFVRHRSKPGETLQQVSRQYYGKPDFYLDIYLANQDVLRNPGRIPDGTSLRIPVYD